MSLLIFALFHQFRRHSLAFQLQSLWTNLNFDIAKYFSVICLPYLFHSLVYQTHYHFKLRGMKEFSNGSKDERRRGGERRRGMKEGGG